MISLLKNLRPMAVLTILVSLVAPVVGLMLSIEDGLFFPCVVGAGISVLAIILRLENNALGVKLSKSSGTPKYLNFPNRFEKPETGGATRFHWWLAFNLVLFRNVYVETVLSDEIMRFRVVERRWGYFVGEMLTDVPFPPSRYRIVKGDSVLIQEDLVWTIKFLNLPSRQQYINTAKHKKTA